MESSEVDQKRLKHRLYLRRFRKQKPWMQSIDHAKQRCYNKKDCKYKYYGGRGIKVLLSNEEVEFIWNRDKAHLLKDPTIDRIDSNGNYEISNCRFIERSENTRIANKGIKRSEETKLKMRMAQKVRRLKER